MGLSSELCPHYADPFVCSEAGRSSLRCNVYDYLMESQEEGKQHSNLRIHIKEKIQNKLSYQLSPIEGV